MTAILTAVGDFLTILLPFVIGPYGLLVFLLLALCLTAYVFVKYGIPLMEKAAGVAKDFLTDIVDVQRSMVDEIKDIKIETNKSGLNIQSILQRQSLNTAKLADIEEEVESQGEALQAVQADVARLTEAEWSDVRDHLNSKYKRAASGK